MFGKSWAVLRGVRGPHAHAVFVLQQDVTSFGRGSSSNIQILDQRVSRQHAKLTLRDGIALLEDLGSHNGTYVHGHQVHRRELQPGDRIRIGVAEYVFDRIKQQLMTSAVFLNKLTTKETVGATIVRRVAREILRSPTADMPSLEAHREQLARTKRPTSELFAQLERPDPRTSRIEAIELPDVPEPQRRPSSQPEYTADRQIDLPPEDTSQIGYERGTQSVPYVTGYSSSFEAAPPETPPGLPEIDAPEIGALLRADSGATDAFENTDAEFETVPLDPRTQRVQTPVPTNTAHVSPAPHSTPAMDLRQAFANEQPSSPPQQKRRPPEQEPAIGPEPAALEAALRTVDAVMRLLRLRDKENGGAQLKIHDRERLRRLEQALRENRRGQGNRRRWARLPCELGAELGERNTSAVVTDIGAGGMRVKGAAIEVQPSEDLTIRIRLGEGRLARIAVFQTRVAWIDAKTGAFGAIFAGPARWELAG